MDVRLLYFDDCPSWRLADERLTEALARTGRADTPIIRRQVTTSEQADELSFRGSPTVLLDGQDPCAEPDSPVGLSCRLYVTPDGLVGAPTIDQLVAAVAAVAADH